MATAAEPRFFYRSGGRVQKDVPSRHEWGLSSATVALRRAHELCRRELDEFVPSPSTQAFLIGVDLLTNVYGSNAAFPDHLEVVREGGEAVHIAFYAPPGRKKVQMLTHWVGRKRQSVWMRQLQDHVARQTLPELARKWLQKKDRPVPVSDEVPASDAA